MSKIKPAVVGVLKSGHSVKTVIGGRWRKFVAGEEYEFTAAEWKEAQRFFELVRELTPPKRKDEGKEPVTDGMEAGGAPEEAAVATEEGGGGEEAPKPKKRGRRKKKAQE